jgi:hypothetical protein
MLCVEVCLAAVKIVARGLCGPTFDRKRTKSAVPLSIGNAQSRKAWIDATIRELKILKSTLETIDTPGERWGLSPRLRWS